MKPAGLHHVSICVGDADAGRDWYVDVLGLAPVARPDFGFPGHWLDAGGQQVHLIEAGETPSRRNHFAVRVDDVAAAAADLRARGVDVLEVPHLEGAGRQAFVNDPWGNLIELNEPEPDG